jgi:hypothetical protein
MHQKCKNGSLRAHRGEKRDQKCIKNEQMALSARTEERNAIKNVSKMNKWLSPRAQREKRDQKCIKNVRMALSARTERKNRSEIYKK